MPRVVICCAGDHGQWSEVGRLRATSWAATGLVAAALAWGGAGYLATKPTDFHDYRVAAVGAAQSAYDALASADLTGTALLAGRVTGPYADSMLGDARDALAGAAKQFAGVSPPDQRTQKMRDELGPLLIKANAVLPGTASDITDKTLDNLKPVEDALDQFLEEHE
jgi:hypothetical protein